MRRLFALCLATLLCSAFTALAEPRHAISMHGEPALAEGFTHFPYVDPAAPKGGSVTYCVIGSFDNLNPFILKSLRTTARGVIDTIFGNLLFEAPMIRSADEAFSLYGLLAERADLSDDRKVLTLTLDPRARWSDGKPVTADDVLFTYEVFTEKGRPPYSQRMDRVEKLEKLDERSVRFTFNDKADREFPLIIAMTPIVAKHAFDKETFDQTTLKPVIGSGPYVIDRVEPGVRIVFRRNPDYWAKDLPSKVGTDNYDRIVIEYFQNANAQFEAFKKGICSIHAETDPVRLKRGFDFPAFHDGRVVLETFKTGIPPVVSGFLFNTRRDKFSDARVRRALGMLYDFEWVNKNLYDGRFERTASYWQGSELSALGRPADARETALLAPFPDAVIPAVLDGTWRPASTDGTGRDRAVLRTALALLGEAGYRLDGGRLVGPDGQQLAFEILTASLSEERLAQIWQRSLDKIGIAASIRTVDDTQMQQRKQRFDFDVVIGVMGFSGSLSPGIEQIGRWGSSSANVEGSFNLAGVADPAIDAAIEAMLAAREEEDYVAAVRVLDRLLISGGYIVPMQHNTDQNLASWSYLKHPAKTPLTGYFLPAWWREGE
jgi:peptide/nickel transport system substrate-binding protein